MGHYSATQAASEFLVRSAERAEVNQGSVARVSDDRAQLVDIVDLSRDGCGLISENAIEIGAQIRVGLSGAGTAMSEVVWRHGDRYGCRFLVPLDEADMAHAFTGARIVHIRQPEAVPPEPHDVPRFTRRTRTLILLGGVVATWSAVIAAISVIVSAA